MVGAWGWRPKINRNRLIFNDRRSLVNLRTATARKASVTRRVTAAS